MRENEIGDFLGREFERGSPCTQFRGISGKEGVEGERGKGESYRPGCFIAAVPEIGNVLLMRNVRLSDDAGTRGTGVQSPPEETE